MAFNKDVVMQKIQRFGGAMFTPVIMFGVFGIFVAVSILCKNPMILGSIAEIGKTSLEPGESTKLKVTVYKRNTGNKKHHMRILMITNDPNHPKVTVNVKR